MLRFDRFTDSARNAAQRSWEVIQRYGHTQIDTEHLLLAMIEQPDSGIPRILVDLRVDSRMLVEQLDAALRISPIKNASNPSGQIFITQRIKQVIDLANEEADRLEDHDISTEHIFLAILKEQNTPAARILGAAGLKRNLVYSSVQRMRKSQPTAQHATREVRSRGDDVRSTNAGDIHLAAEAMRAIQRLSYGRRGSLDDENDALRPNALDTGRLVTEGIHLHEAVQPAITYLTHVPLDKRDSSGAEMPPEGVISDLINILAGMGDKRAIPALTRIANTERKIRIWEREDTAGHPIDAEHYARQVSNDYERDIAKTAIQTILSQKYETCPQCNGNRTLPCSSCAGTGEGWRAGEKKS